MAWRTGATWALLCGGALKTVVTGAPAAFGRCAELHGQRNTFARHIDLHHLHLDDVTGFDHLTCVVDKLVRELTHMHQAVLVHSSARMSLTVITPNLSLANSAGARVLSMSARPISSATGLPVLAMICSTTG